MKSIIYFDQIYDEYYDIRNRIPASLYKYTIENRVYKIYYRGNIYFDNKYSQNFYVTNANIDKSHFIRSNYTSRDIIKSDVDLYLSFFSIPENFPYDLFNDAIYFLFKKYNFDITYNKVGYKMPESSTFVFHKEIIY